MSDLREELAKLLDKAFEEYGDDPAYADFVADRLLPFVQAQVDAAVKAERERCAKLICPGCADIYEWGQYDGKGQHRREGLQSMACRAAAIREGEGE